MSSNENPPPLSLSDIMHPMSPSPAPVEDLSTPFDEHQPRYYSDSQQEPLTDSEVLIIRNRLQELGLVMRYGPENEDLPTPRLGVVNHLTIRERELTEMILRLTSCPRIDPAQLEQQAAIISTLTSQRDYLAAEAEEERLKLDSERENWNRTAEALLTQKTRPLKTEDMDAQRASYEAEIKSLREKLHDRHRRLSVLEQEILRLKPLLLMQPYSNQRVKQTLATQSQTSKVQEKGRRRDVDATPARLPSLNTPAELSQKFDPTTYPYGYQYKPEVSTLSQSSNSNTFLHEGPPASGLSSQRRRPKDHSNIQKGKKRKHYRSTTMSSDAYTEHVLLAAQKIGRKRTALVTGLQRLADREKEELAHEYDQLQSRKEQEQLQKERLDRSTSGTSSIAYYRSSEDSTPRRGSSSTLTGSKTPKRAGYPFGQHHNANPGGVNTPLPSTYVFVNTSATRMSKLPAGHSSGSVLKTPLRPEAALNSSPAMRSSQTMNPPTPLDSLVDAARMMGESGDRSSSRRTLLNEPESPTAKRRKVSADKVLTTRGTSKLGRVKSGLDVLADQAAAVKKPGQASAHLSDNDSHTINDRKGKGKASTQTTDADWSTPSKYRGSTRSARPPSRRLFTSGDGLLSASSPAMGRGTTRTRDQSRRSVTPEPRVIALPTVLSSGFSSSEVARVGLNLRPVSGWGDRPALDEDEEDSNSDSTCDSPTRNETSRVGFSSPRDPNALEANNPPLSGAQMEREQLLPASMTHTPSHQQVNSRASTPQAVTQSSIRQTLTTDQPEAFQTTAGSDIDEDEDAEGEEDEENTDNDAEMGSRYHPSRSRSPPPPDPPGNDNGPGPSNEQDPDLDADGDMDVDDKGTPPSGTSPATHQTRGGHRQMVTFVMEVVKPCYNVPMFFFTAQCLIALRELSCVQHSEVSQHTIVYNVGNCAAPHAMPFHRGVERDDSICDTVDISKSASIVSH